jgi:hypothetical protein
MKEFLQRKYFFRQTDEINQDHLGGNWQINKIKS